MTDFDQKLAAVRAKKRAERLEPPAYLNEVPPIESIEAPLEPLPFIDVAAWDRLPVPPREWSVLERIPLRQPTLFSGEGAAGKSKILLQLSCAHVLGKYWLGLPVEQGPAIYLGAEGRRGPSARCRRRATLRREVLRAVGRRPAPALPRG